MQFSRIEKTLILAFYYLDKSERISAFVSQFNKYFHKDVSTQTIIYETSKLNNINPSNNMKNDANDLGYVELWDKYIKGDRITELKSLYKTFKKGEFLESDFNTKSHYVSNKKTNIVDLPKEAPVKVEEIKQLYKRNPTALENALVAANYSCELNCGSELFVSKDRKGFYTEGHHLIPLGYQDEFEYSLDVEANIVSLCPMCHKKLHYGADVENELLKLYINRADRLKKCGIFVSIEQLMLMYR